ncbi:MAG: PHP domain-containing protein [Treponema sp.]|jgi:predicted metal-dependent phosphoesterase TrpH|nr:PHP domain-containing protein [Treponema sp.]
MKGSIDFHIHSCYSDDGEFTPSELVRMCAEKGIVSMSISDHNCVAGIDEAMRKADELYLHCVPAIEIDCMYYGINFHVLGYGIDYRSADFAKIEERIRKQCAKTSEERLALINKLGFRLKGEELEKLNAGAYWSEQWNGELFAEVLLNSEDYQDHSLLLPYRKGGARSDNPYVNFYWDWCSQGKACFVPMNFPEMKDVIEIIHQNRGKAVLAHPGISLNGKYDLLDKIIHLGIDGLEVHSSYHDRLTAEWFHEQAQRYKLEETSGSDFHGKTKPSIQLGQFEKL